MSAVSLKVAISLEEDKSWGAKFYLMIPSFSVSLFWISVNEMGFFAIVPFNTGIIIRFDLKSFEGNIKQQQQQQHFLLMLNETNKIIKKKIVIKISPRESVFLQSGETFYLPKTAF